MKISLIISFFCIVNAIHAQNTLSDTTKRHFSGILVLDSVKFGNRIPLPTNDGPNFIQLDSLNGVVYTRLRQKLTVMEGTIKHLQTKVSTDSIITSCILEGKEQYRGERLKLEIIELINNQFVVHYFKLYSGPDCYYYAHPASKEEENYLREYFK